MTERSVGSNPTPSATRAGERTTTRRQAGRPTRCRSATIKQLTGWPVKRRGGRAAEGNRLLSGWSGKTGPRVRIPASPPFAGAFPGRPGRAASSVAEARPPRGRGLRLRSLFGRGVRWVIRQTGRHATADPTGRGSGDPTGSRGAVLRGSGTARSGRRAGRAAAAGPGRPPRPKAFRRTTRRLGEPARAPRPIAPHPQVGGTGRAVRVPDAIRGKWQAVRLQIEIKGAGRPAQTVGREPRERGCGARK